jgi:hypothetical protein
MSRANYLLFTDYQLLEWWCQHVNRMFESSDNYGPFLVGSCLERLDYRDVDLRLMLTDDGYASYASTFRTYLNLSVSLWGSRATGLPIDFQLQDTTEANKRYHGRRNAMGLELL